MAYERQYQNGVGWQNEPSVATPINASNLNQMDQAIVNVDAEVYQAVAVIESDMYDMQQDIAGKQDTLVFDDHPILGSSKPVTSDGIFRAIAQSGGGGGGDSSLDEVYLIGLDNMPSSISPALTINTVSRIFDKDKPEYLMFRFGRMAQESGWSGGQTITLNVNNTGDFAVKKNHITQTTDTWTIKKEVLYIACINCSAGPSGNVYYWDFFEVPFDAAGNYDILPIDHGGTGNALGYIRTGQTANTTAGTAATAEGADNTIRGNYSHAEGQLNTATGNYSHAGGYYNTAGYPYQTVIGHFNDNKMTTLFEVGNGTGTTDRENAFEVYSTGDVKLSGSLYVGTSIYDHNNEFVVSVSANPSGTATTPLSKIKIDGTIFSVGLPSDPLAIANGGTGNTVGYIQTGRKENTTVGTNATIEGANNTVSGTNGYAGGLENISRYDNQTVIGKYNNNKNSLFEIGNGTSTSARSNAFEVYSNGNATVQGTLTVSSVSASSNISASGNVSATNITATGTVSDANGALNATVANPTGVIGGGRLQYIKIGNTSYTVGDGTLIMSKKRYQIYANSWSTSQSSGYYTYNLTLSTPQLNTSYPPNVYISGSGDTTEPTDTQKSMYALLVKCNLTATNKLVLYAKVKPTSAFYIYVEGVAV